MKIFGLGGAGQDVGTRLSEWQLLPGDPSEAVPPRACGAGASGHDTSREFSRSSSWVFPQFLLRAVVDCARPVLRSPGTMSARRSQAQRASAGWHLLAFAE